MREKRRWYFCHIASEIKCYHIYFSKISKYLKHNEFAYPSWFLWVICWTPAYVLTFLNLSNRGRFSSYGFIVDRILGYSSFFALPLQLLYSHLNPIFLFALIKDFQDFLTVPLGHFRNILFYKMTEKPADDKKETNHGNKPKDSHSKKCQLTKKRCHDREREPEKKDANKWMLLMITLVTVSFVHVLAALLINSSTLNEQKIITAKTRVSVKEHFQKQKSKNLQYEELVQPNDQNNNVRLKCSENQGNFNFQLKRCYFLVKHGNQGLNFTDQIASCNSRGAILSYPRSKVEMKFLWEFFEIEQKELTLQDFRNFTIHVGVTRSFNGYSGIDNKTSFSLLSDIWFFQQAVTVYRNRAFVPFLSPTLCLSKAKVLSECMKNSLKRYSICSHDFKWTEFIS